MFHGEKCDSCMGVCLWFFSSRQQLSPPLAICSQLQLVSIAVRHGAVSLEQRVVLHDTYVKYGSARNIHPENQLNVYLKGLERRSLVQLKGLERQSLVQLKGLECQSLVQERQHNCWSVDPIKQQ
jgi:hypothetical protein